MADLEWRRIPSWPYDASSDGQVRNARTGRVIGQFPHKSGYAQCQLWRGGERRSVGVHIVVTEAFHGPRPAGHEAAHCDGNRANNAASNMAWKTPSENTADREVHGVVMRGERSGMCKYPESTIDEIRSLRAAGATYREIEARTGVRATYARAIVCGYRRSRPA